MILLNHDKFQVNRLPAIPLAEGLKNRRRIVAFFEGVEQAKRAFDRAPNGGKYAAFFAGIDQVIEEWQAFGKDEGRRPRPYDQFSEAIHSPPNLPPAAGRSVFPLRWVRCA